MVHSSLKKWLNKIVIAFVIGNLSLTDAWASSTNSSANLPFTSTMTTLQQAISGPFLLSASIILIVVTCLMLAFGEWGEGFKKIINMVLWLSIAFFATSFITSLFGSGAVI